MRERNIKINVFLNEEEKKNFDKKARQAGLNKSEFFRKIILGYRLKEKPDERFYEVLSQLRGMATNLNQIARTANRYDYVKIDKLNMFLNSIEDLILLLKEVYLIPRREGELNGNNKNMEM